MLISTKHKPMSKLGTYFPSLISVTKEEEFGVPESGQFMGLTFIRILRNNNNNNNNFN